MSAQPFAQRRGMFAALAAQVSAFLLEPVDEEQEVASEPARLEPYPVVAIVPAAPKVGAGTIARLLAAELAGRADGAALLCMSGAGPRRNAPPIRAATRLATALRGVGSTRACGRLCIVHGAKPAAVVAAARYLAPVVVGLAADGSAPRAAEVADRVVVLAAAGNEPSLAAALAGLLGGSPITVVNRVTEIGTWHGRADIAVPEARLAARAALVGARATGPLGAAIAELADALGPGGA